MLHLYFYLVTIYKTLNGQQFNSCPARRLSQSFNLKIGNVAITPKHSLLTDWAVLQLQNLNDLELLGSKMAAYGWNHSKNEFNKKLFWLKMARSSWLDPIRAVKLSAWLGFLSKRLVSGFAT
uniref:Uncharacterized protein n=1 Tax=Tetranychus urticae TaxID=32264 RepID=T1KBT7_TETUR